MQIEIRQQDKQELNEIINSEINKMYGAFYSLEQLEEISTLKIVFVSRRIVNLLELYLPHLLYLSITKCVACIDFCVI